MNYGQSSAGPWALISLGLVISVLLGSVPAQDIQISEFLTSNGSSRPVHGGQILDEDGQSSDWIELQNTTGQAIDLSGWYLTDDPNDLSRWGFPAGTRLEGGRFMIVFASGKDRADPDQTLHTNFKLAREGGFLALVRPDGRTIVSSYRYPSQFRDVAYGVSTGGTAEEEVLVTEGTPATALIPEDDALTLSWTEPDFDDSQWLQGHTGVGYDYGSLIRLDTRPMRGVNTSVYVRIPFEIDDVTSVMQVTLRMKYDDGFVAYLNGVPVARANAPQDEQLSWRSDATATHEDSDSVIFEDFVLSRDGLTALVSGRNVLAIQGLNTNLTSSDLLILPELRVQRLYQNAAVQATTGYLLPPTPGQPNGQVIADLGPRIYEVTSWPSRLSANQDLVIHAHVEKTSREVTQVILVPRINYLGRLSDLAEGYVQMHDDGQAPDAAAGDGVYTAALPAGLYDRGDMVRWYIQATDTEGNISRDPPLLSGIASPEYCGTVVDDPARKSALPVMQWFVENVSASERDSGTRGSVYYLDEFYDNVLIHRRGGSTAGQAKTHFKFNFNPGYKFRFDPNEARVNEINLNSTFSDKAYLRQPLAFEAYDWCGCPGSIAYPIVGYRNGAFFGVQILIEEPEEELLEREGLDPDGALYKMYNEFTSASAEKKTRRWEGNQDLSNFEASINWTSGTERHNNIFDLVNLPLTLDYLTATILVHQNDHPHKNHYLYCDSDGSGQWCLLPWDHDLTWGSNWDGSSYHDTIYADDDRVPGKSADVKPSHPFVGRQDCKEWNNHWNRLIDALLNDDTVRRMFLRRLRTVMDDFLQAPGTPYPELFIENRIDELVAQMAPDVQRDYNMWADPWPWGGEEGYKRDQSFAEAIDILKTDYLAVRRQHLFVTHNIDHMDSYAIPGSYSAGIPNAQPADAMIAFGAFDYNPLSADQNEEYIELLNHNDYAVDISYWQLTGGVQHTFTPGTVIVPDGSLYVSPNVRAFWQRGQSPHRGQGCFVQGN